LRARGDWRCGLGLWLRRGDAAHGVFGVLLKLSQEHVDERYG
jgi:hypothetical protein